MDLQGIQSIRARVATNVEGFSLEVRAGAKGGTLLGKTTIPGTGDLNAWQEIEIGLNQIPEGQNDIFFLINQNNDSEGKVRLDWLKFLKDRDNDLAME